VLPFGVDPILQPPGPTGLTLKWLTIHDFSFPGMVGFVFFALSLVGLWKVWPLHRALVFWLVGGQLAFIVLFWGLPAVAAWVAGLGLLPFIYIFGAVGLLTVSERAARWLAGVVAVEWLLYIRTLYYPIEGVSPGQYVVGWVLIVAGILVMLVAGYAALVQGWPERSVRGRTRPEQPLLAHG